MNGPAPPIRLGPLLLAATLLLAPPLTRAADGGAGDGGEADAATDAGGDGGWYTLSGTAESGCTCSAPVGGATPRLLLPLAWVLELFSPLE